MRLIQKFIRSEDGSIAAETGLIIAALGFIAVGVLDFGLAYSRNLGLANAARAGMQYALVRKPVDGDYTAIQAAVTAAAPPSTSSANRAVSTVMYCECPDGTSINCTSEDGEDLTCDDGSLRAAYLDITISEDYSMLLSYPGINSPLSMSETVTVRLN